MKLNKIKLVSVLVIGLFIGAVFIPILSGDNKFENESAENKVIFKSDSMSCSYLYGYIKPEENLNDELPITLDDPPSSWDWRSATIYSITGDWTTPVKDQGCSDCYDFAAHGALEAAVDIANLDPNLDIDLSEQYPLSCDPDQGCSGGSGYGVFDFLYHETPQGALLESCFPYQGDDAIPCSDKCSDWQDHLYPIHDYGASWYPGVNAIKSMIYENGPVCLSFLVYSDFSYYPTPSWDENGVYTYDGTSGYEGSHLVTVVGYQDTPGNPEYDGYWICKNSWGFYWGPWNGFFGISYGTCEIDDYVTWVEVESAQELAYSPTTHDFGILSEGNTYQTTFDIWNDGIVGTLDWSLSDIYPWLSYYPISGSSTGEHDAITVTIDTTGLAPNTYNGDITISTNDGNGIFTVTFTIPDNPPIACFEWSDIDGSNPGTMINFDASCSYDDCEINSYEWDWTSDGVYDYTGGPIVSHDYGDQYGHIVTLRVTDTISQTDTFSCFVQANIILDADQSIFNRGYRMMPGWDASQEFIPTYGILSSVDLYMSKFGSPTGDVTFQIRQDTADGAILYEGVVLPGDVPAFPDYEWVTVDISDITVTPGNTYYIVLKDATGADSHNCIQWGWCDSYASGSGGPYDGGWFWFRKEANPTWSPIRDWDYTFRTFGYD